MTVLNVDMSVPLLELMDGWTPPTTRDRTPGGGRKQMRASQNRTQLEQSLPSLLLVAINA